MRLVDEGNSKKKITYIDRKSETYTIKQFLHFIRSFLKSEGEEKNPFLPAGYSENTT